MVVKLLFLVVEVVNLKLNEVNMDLKLKLVKFKKNKSLVNI